MHKKIRYFLTSDDLIEYFAGIHMNKRLPSIIVIEDLVDYIDIQKCEQVRIIKFISKFLFVLFTRNLMV